MNFDTTGPAFLEMPRGLLSGAAVLFGVPYDGTTSFRPGTRFGPAAIRAASIGLETYSPRLDADYADRTVCDSGDVEIPFGAPEPVLAQVESAVRAILNRSSRPIMMGGEHSLTPPVVHALLETYPDLAVIQLDAHADLRESFLGSANSHACAMRRCLDRLPTDSLLQIGIRSGTRAEFQEMKGAERLISPSCADTLRARLDAWGKRPLYVTVDLDYFDPSVLCGTGTPEPGGADFNDFERLCSVLHGRNVVGADIMELSPHYDPSGVSAVVAAKVVRELTIIVSQHTSKTPQ